VRVAPDLREGRVFVSIVGDDESAQERFRWLKRMAPEIREHLAKRVVLKFLPHFTYVLDKSGEKVARVLHLIDEIDAGGGEKAKAGDGEVLP
jgi:ribosome-binding factor A